LYNAIPDDDAVYHYQLNIRKLLNEADDNNCRMDPTTGKLIMTEFDLDIACNGL